MTNPERMTASEIIRRAEVERRKPSPMERVFLRSIVKRVLEFLKKQRTEDPPDHD